MGQTPVLPVRRLITGPTEGPFCGTTFCTTLPIISKCRVKSSVYNEEQKIIINKILWVLFELNVELTVQKGTLTFI